MKAVGIRRTGESWNIGQTAAGLAVYIISPGGGRRQAVYKRKSVKSYAATVFTFILKYARADKQHG